MCFRLPPGADANESTAKQGYSRTVLDPGLPDLVVVFLYSETEEGSLRASVLAILLIPLLPEVALPFAVDILTSLTGGGCYR